MTTTLIGTLAPQIQIIIALGRGVTALLCMISTNFRHASTLLTWEMRTSNESSQPPSSKSTLATAALACEKTEALIGRSGTSSPSLARRFVIRVCALASAARSRPASASAAGAGAPAVGAVADVGLATASVKR
jgi:hypothetical protein